MMQTEASYLHIPTIPAGFLRHLVEPLLERERFPGDMNPSYRALLLKEKLTVSEYSDFSQSLCISLKDEWLGLLDRPVPLGSHIALLHLLHSSPTLSEALTNLNRFYSLFLGDEAELFDLSLWESEQRILLSYPRSAEHLQIAALMRVLKVLSWLCQEQLPLKKLVFNTEPMPFDKEFAYLFGAWPSYEKGRAQLQFHPDILSKAVAPAINAEQYAAENHVHSLLWRNESNLEKRVYADITLHLSQGVFSAAAVAERLSMSRHTLGRRLKELNTGYSEILSRVRKDRALQHLHGTEKMSIEQLAEVLGYVEMASFSRAFKQWFACSPSQYWQQHNTSS